jgi:hypothetical protein
MMVTQKFILEKHLEISCKKGPEGSVFWVEGEVN